MASYVLEGTTGPWETVIGLEVHAQVISHAKLFSGAATAFGAPPNTQVSFVDAAFPGMLPVINRECVAQAVRTGLGLNARINPVSRFDRKNYFYADLPAGYQISQFAHPIVGEGKIEIELADGETKEIGVTRLHLEQDAGKSLHDQHPSKSLIDLNRAGVALMEIVSEPDLRSPEEAGAYLRKLRTILRYLGTCDGNMDEGSMRADVNVSVRKHGEPFRTRCEVKNVNSIRFVMQAIEAEAKRQIEVWEAGGAVGQETRLYDPGRGETRSMRSKEDAHDYRYFPDPDLLPLVLDEAWIAELKAGLPELPDAKKSRFVRDYALPVYDAGVLVAEQATADFYETVAKGRDAKLAANWVMGDLFAALNRTSRTIETSPVAAAALGALLDRMADRTINGRIAKEVFEAMVETGQTPDAIIEARGLRQVTDTGAIDQAVAAVLAANGDKLAEYKSGKDKLFGFFVGQVMKAMAGKGNPALVNDGAQAARSMRAEPGARRTARAWALALALIAAAAPALAAELPCPPDPPMPVLHLPHLRAALDAGAAGGDRRARLVLHRRRDGVGAERHLSGGIAGRAGTRPARLADPGDQPRHRRAGRAARTGTDGPGCDRARPAGGDLAGRRQRRAAARRSGGVPSPGHGRDRPVAGARDRRGADGQPALPAPARPARGRGVRPDTGRGRAADRRRPVLPRPADARLGGGGRSAGRVHRGG